MARIARLMRGGMVVIPILLLVGLVFQVERADFRGNHQDSLWEQQFVRDFRRVRIRIKGKKRVVKELLAKRITLLEAAGYFRALDRLPPEFYWAEFRREKAGATDEERHCHEVIGWLQAEMGVVDPCVALALAAQLEQQLHDHLQRGPLQLPEVELPEAFIDDSEPEF